MEPRIFSRPLPLPDPSKELIVIQTPNQERYFSCIVAVEEERYINLLDRTRKSSMVNFSINSFNLKNQANACFLLHHFAAAPAKIEIEKEIIFLHPFVTEEI